MMKRNRLFIHNLRRLRLLKMNCLLTLAALAGLAGGGVTPSAIAQEAKPREYRVNNFIESGNFADAKGWTLEGFHIEKATGSISRKGEEARWGTATTTFQGPDGFYKIRIRYQDEGDGISQGRLSVGGRTIGSWFFDGILVNTFEWREFDGVEIKKGDKIVLAADKDRDEYARFTGIEILPSKPRTSAIDAAMVEKKEHSMDLVPVAGHPAVKSGREYLLDPGLPFTGSAGTYWVYLEKGQPFRLTSWPPFDDANPSLQYSLTKIGEDKPLVEETLVSESNVPIQVSVPNAGEGLHELKVSTAPGDRGNLKISFDAPGVTKLAAREGYFFVPKGARGLSIRTERRLVLMNAADQVMLDDWFDKNGVAVVEVPAGSDNQLWYFQGALDELAGAPPYVATRSEAMLVPAELLN